MVTGQWGVMELSASSSAGLWLQGLEVTCRFVTYLGVLPEKLDETTSSENCKERKWNPSERIFNILLTAYSP